MVWVRRELWVLSEVAECVVRGLRRWLVVVLVPLCEVCELWRWLLAVVLVLQLKAVGGLPRWLWGAVLSLSAVLVVLRLCLCCC